MSISRHDSEATVQVRTFGITFQKGHFLPGHHAVPPSARGWHQLIYATRGAVTVRTDDCAWVAPPHRGVWVPASCRFRLEMSGVVALRMLYLKGRRAASISTGPRNCAVVNVTPLLRELILRTVQIGALDSSIPAQKRLIGVLYDELKALVAVPLQLPMPQDPRAARFAALAAADVEQTSVEALLRRCGASRRSMERLFRQSTAMSLGQWLRRQKLLHGLRRLAGGEAVNAVALELGYNSASAFIAMFRRELGQTPTRYFES